MDKDYGILYVKKFIESHEPEDLALALALGIFTSFAYLSYAKKTRLS